MFMIPLDNTKSIPLYEQIYKYLKSEIQNGVLLLGSKLPSVRTLALSLSVSRNTIDMAYGQLLSEGYIESIEKKGYYICFTGDNIYPKNNLANATPRFLEENVSPNITYDFSPFTVDSKNFPYDTWRKLSKNCINIDNNIIVSGNAQGDVCLRNAICGYLHESRGVNASPNQIIVGAGADYLLQLLTQIIPVDSVIAMENPSYIQAYRIFTKLGIKTVSIPIDSLGMNLEKLRSSLATIAYVTPSHQYPLGMVMPIKRRISLLNWAKSSTNRYIIEDDHDSEFRYKGKPIPALQGLDSSDRVIYVGTFSSAISPALRIGYIVLPYTLLKNYKENISFYASTVSRVEQGIITSFIEQGYFERHLNKMRKIYKGKHDYLVNCLKIFGDSIEIVGKDAGLYIMVRLHCKLDEKQIIAIALENGIKLYGSKEYYTTPNITQIFPEFLLGFSNLDEQAICSGVDLLYKTLYSHLIS